MRRTAVYVLQTAESKSVGVRIHRNMQEKVVCDGDIKIER